MRGMLLRDLSRPCIRQQRRAAFGQNFPMKSGAPNQSLQPTPVGVVSSADAGHVVVPARLSFGRSATGGTDGTV